MKFKNIKLGAIEWEVKFGDIPDYIAEALETEPENLLGATDKSELTIYIRDNLKPTIARTTLLHELVHAMCDSFNLGFDDNEHEEIVDAIAKATYNFLHQNRIATEWLMKEE
jgi:Zn-dependent peptidase ImmA (M78 family)